MRNIIKKLMSWRAIVLLFWMVVMFVAISQPSYTVHANDPLINTTTAVANIGTNDLDHMVKTVSNVQRKYTANKTADLDEPYVVPVVLKPEQQALLSSLMDGYIDYIPVKEGDVVKKGQLLVKFDCRIQQAQYEKAVSQMEEAGSSHMANMRLKSLGAISDPEVEKSKYALSDAKAELSIRKELVNYCQITAPFDGVIVKSYIKQFQTINKNIELLELLDNGKLRIELIIPSSWLSWLTNGYKFKVDITEVNKSYLASVTRILPKIDPVSQTIRIIAQIDESSNGLISGMNGKAYFDR